MNVDRVVSIEAAQFKRLVDVVVWYDAAPDEEFGDRFHDNVSDTIGDLMPTIPETTVPYPSHYYSYPDVIDGRVFIKVNSDRDGMDDFTIEVVPC